MPINSSQYNYAEQTIRERLQRTIVKRGLTQSQIAESSGLHQSQVSRMLNDSNKEFSINFLVKICGVLDLTLEQLVSWDEDGFEQSLNGKTDINPGKTEALSHVLRISKAKAESVMNIFLDLEIKHLFIGTDVQSTNAIAAADASHSLLLHQSYPGSADTGRRHRIITQFPVDISASLDVSIDRDSEIYLDAKIDTRHRDSEIHLFGQQFSGRDIQQYFNKNQNWFKDWPGLQTCAEGRTFVYSSSITWEFIRTWASLNTPVGTSAWLRLGDDGALLRFDILRDGKIDTYFNLLSEPSLKEFDSSLLAIDEYAQRSSNTDILRSGTMTGYLQELEETDVISFSFNGMTVIPPVPPTNALKTVAEGVKALSQNQPWSSPGCWDWNNPDWTDTDVSVIECLKSFSDEVAELAKDVSLIPLPPDGAVEAIASYVAGGTNTIPAKEIWSLESYMEQYTQAIYSALKKYNPESLDVS